MRCLKGETGYCHLRQLNMRRRQQRSEQKNRLTEQISQHYIYNSLQVIAGLCDTEPAKAKDALITFAEYLRINLEDITEKQLILFEREIEHTKAFVALEKLAGDKVFDVEYRLGVTDFMMPPLVLQPVVENAIKYGGGSDGEPNRIIIETSEIDRDIVIEVINTLPGSISSGRPRGSQRSVALENVSSRLLRYCRGSLKLETSGGFAKTTITIPKRNR